MLSLVNLDKHFGALHVTDNVSLDLRPGECHALIGPNGAGKTTLIHQISGTLQPDSGQILFNGSDITALPPHRRAQAGLGRTFQITSILPEFTVLENVALAVQARRGSSFRFLRTVAKNRQINNRALECLALFTLTDRADRPASALSHGEKRLLELAIAIAGEPEALLLDEPMAGMGKEESATLTETLLTLKRDYPILLVEHDMDAVFALADRVSVLVYGQIVATGSPDEVRANPQARAAYLGDEAC